jgi:dihydropteroate synthase
VAAETGAGWVAMHMRGTPATMQHDARYDDVVAEVRAFLAERVAAAEAAGVGEIWIDPGIGFGKTMDHNLSLLRHLDELVAVGRPVVVGVSRKGFLGTLTGRSDAGAAARDARGDPGPAPADPPPLPSPVDDRLEASVALATWALGAGARMVRAHDVLATVHATRVVGP